MSHHGHALRKITLLLGSCLTVMAGATIAPALPGIRDAFRQDPNVELMVPLVFTVPGLAIAFAAPLMGLLVDRVGRPGVMILGLAAYAAAGTSGLYLDSLTGLLIGRALLGASVAAVMTAVTTLMADFFHGHERVRLLGLQSTFMGLGAVVFLLSGGALADISWRAPFAIYLASLLLIPAAYIGFWGKDELGYASIHMGKGEPVPSGIIVFLYGLACLFVMMFYLIPVQIPFSLGHLGVSSAKASGVAIASYTLVSALTSLQFPRVRTACSHVFIVGVSFAFIGAGFAGVARAGSYGMVLASLMLAGLGGGLFMPNANTWLASITPERVRGRIFGGFAASVFIGQFLSPLAASPLIAKGGMFGPWGMWGVAGMAAIAIAIGFLLAAVVWRPEPAPH